MSFLTLTRHGKVIQASHKAADRLKAQGWVETSDTGPVAVVAPRPVAVAKPKSRRRVQK